MPNPFDLAEPALALAKKVGSSATNVHQARQDTLFRASGLLPGFSAANQEIGDSLMQVKARAQQCTFVCCFSVGACWDAFSKLAWLSPGGWLCWCVLPRHAHFSSRFAQETLEVCSVLVV